ncbi:N-terminal methylation site-containing protein [Limimonas halophila]|uniref:N-terminal methylation site-containing protein n=2 Tax=Limimonas halophila TaxID=1082479 RepID=A0A1G7UVB6_9PROT|nr:N-terminal methylation site-containing protein [Limimonas halophila]
MEVLVALTILAVGLTALFRAFGTGVRGVEASGDRAHLLAAARSRMADVGAGIPLQPGTYSGESAAGRWRVRVTPYDGTGAPARTRLTRLMRVQLVVVGPDGSRQHLSTLRLAPRGRP